MPLLSKPQPLQATRPAGPGRKKEDLKAAPMAGTSREPTDGTPRKAGEDSREAEATMAGEDSKVVEVETDGDSKAEEEEMAGVSSREVEEVATAGANHSKEEVVEAATAGAAAGDIDSSQILINIPTITTKTKAIEPL